jgi:prepilin-type N-terminal cleavage/methylation domain-containing protein
MRTIKKILNATTGFTLAEIMIAVAVLGGLSLVGINLSKQATTTQKKFQTDIDADFIVKEIAGVLATACNTSQIIGKNSAATSAGTITDINGKYSVSSTTGFGASQIKIASYEISNSNFAEITDTNTETALVINFAMPKIVSSTVPTLKPRRIKLIITKTGANIETCKSAWVNQQDYWTKNGNDLFYTSGNVGIGVPAPLVRLDVDKGIRPGSTGVAVDGACTVEGTLAYDLAAHKPVYCNNESIWKAIGSSSCVHGTWTQNTAGAYTFVVPAGCVSLKVTLIGGGGGGGTSGGDQGIGSGGGGACVITNYVMTVVPAQSISVTIGAGAPPHNLGYNWGFRGGNSIFGTITASGGGTGASSSGSIGGWSGVGGNGGTCSVPGTSGGAGGNGGGQGCGAGGGGGASGGTSGGCGTAGSSTWGAGGLPGQPGTGYGSGGGNDTPGSSGYALIEY